MEKTSCKGGDIIKHKFVINGRLPSLNEYINVERSGYHAANGFKRKWQKYIKTYIRASGIKPIKYPVSIVYRFYEVNRKRDKDNIAGLCHKFVQDALVESGILKDDSWNYVVSFSDDFYLDRSNPRIEVTLIEERTKNAKT